MDLRKLKKLIELVEEYSITELEVTEGEEKVRISKSVTLTQSAATVMPQYQIPAATADRIAAALRVRFRLLQI